MPKIKKKIIVFIPVVVLITAVFLLYAINAWDVSKPEDSISSEIDYNPPTKEQIDDGNRIKKETVNPDKSSTPNSSSVEMSLVSSSTVSGNLKIRVLIDGIRSGTCTITLSSGSRSVIKTVPTQTSASSTTCQGFDIPTSELSPGKWTYAISGNFNDGSSSKVTGEAEL